MPEAKKRKRIGGGWIALIAVVLFIVAAGTIDMSRHPPAANPKVTVGAKDEVYYARQATASDAARFGEVLKTLGFFTDRGTRVLIERFKNAITLSFVVDEGGWDHAATVEGFEEIGRRVAHLTFGFPLLVHLSDATWHVRKELTIGKAGIGTHDIVYYLGSANESQAKALGQALRDAKFFGDVGNVVVLTKNDTTSVGFVLNDSVPMNTEVLNGFSDLARKVAPSVGGLPMNLRILSVRMEVRKDIPIN